MQHADTESLVPVSFEGLADDAQVGALSAASGGQLLAVRLLLPAEQGCRCGCGGGGPAMVAVRPDDQALPARERTELQRLAPGVAIADEAWQALIGGTVALGGRDVRISMSGRLSDGTAPGPIVLLLDDLTASLAVSPPQHLPTVRTLAVVCGHASHTRVAPGWTLLPGRAADVPVATGLPVPAERKPVST